MKTTITDQRIVSCEDTWSLEMSLQAILEHEGSQMEDLERSLGILWKAEDFEGINKTSSSDRTDQVRYPLAVVLKPNLLEEIQKHFASVKAQANSPTAKAESLFEMDKTEFLSMMGAVTQYQSDGTAGKIEKPSGFTQGRQRTIGDR